MDRIELIVFANFNDEREQAEIVKTVIVSLVIKTVNYGLRVIVSSQI